MATSGPRNSLCCLPVASAQLRRPPPWCQNSTTPPFSTALAFDAGDVFSLWLGEGVADDAHRDDGLLGLGQLGQAFEAGGEAFVFAGLHVIEFPNDELVLCCGDGGDGELAEQGEEAYG